MDIVKANIVTSTAGRDKGEVFFVLATEGDFLLLADGKTRPVERPKRKRRKHAALLRRDGARFPRGSEATKPSQIVSFVKPSPRYAAVIKTRRDNTWQNPT